MADEERGAVKIVEGERLLSPEALVAMVLTYAKSLAQASPPPRAPPRPRPRPRGCFHRRRDPQPRAGRAARSASWYGRRDETCPISTG